MPLESYKPLGAIGVLILTMGLTFVVYKWPQGKHMTFSQHVAQQKESIIYYICLFTVALPILGLFFYEWFWPKFNLSNCFIVSIFISMFFQYVCNFVPETGGIKTKYHQLLAFLSALFILPCIITMALSQDISSIARIVSFVSLLLMIYTLILMIVSKAKSKYNLFLQIGYFAPFFISVLAATYIN